MRQKLTEALDYWVDLARLLERGLFDGLFLADVLGEGRVSKAVGDRRLLSDNRIP
jgi:alkanesulfonate monooxygenase SsuD/methylene tetrahydromethanopterin reductase-like flavin-dependent oxidoreductase (luciferase family)